ncbi:hypothetical protein EDD11_003707 [Mortierella claussenii]|nr:hypothetical protein EDD11_003707 [Mortierella claussenii]
MAVIQLITSSSPYLRRIDLTECRLITNLTVQVIAQLCGRQLEDLSLKGCGLVSDDAIMELAHHCTRLQSVNIGQCTRVGDRGLQALLKSSGRTWRPDPVLSGMTTKNASLSKLGIAGCYGITINGLLMISEQLSSHDESTGEVSSSLVSLEFTCPTLKTAQRTALTEQPAYSRPSSQAMRFFQTLPSTLEEITICDAHTLSQDDIICLVDKVGSSLRTLRLDNANSVDSETLTHVLAVCPHLTVLCIPRATRLDDAGVIELAKAKCATSLLELDLSACHALTDVCLIRLATAKTSSSYDSHLSPSSLSYLGTSKGKERAFVDAGPSPPCLFSNLRRLDLSYNDKLTLTGIIPLVMSLKNLCALDVSFCGDGVTRSWKLSLESIRPILTSAGAVSSCSSSPSSAGSSTVSDRDDSQEGSLSESCNSISEDDDEESMYPMMNSRPERIQPQQMPPPQTSECATSNQSMLSIQNLQQLVSGFIPLPTIASRRGLGRYVGPLLNRSTTPPAVVTAASHDNVVNPRHPPQYAEQGQEAASSERKHQGRQDQQQQQHARRRSSASSTSSCSSMTSTISSSSPSPSASASSPSSPVTISPPSPSSFFLNPLFSKKEHQKQQQNDLSHNQCRRSSSSSCSSSSSSSSFKPKSKIKTKIKLSDRFDVLETTPRRVGMPAGFYLGSWFTPQHHYQLQELHQIQTQRHQEAQDAAALNMAAGELGEGIGGVGAAAALADQPTAVPSLPIEMMHHPVIATPRAGVAIMGSGTGAGDQQTMPDTDMLELNETLSRDMTLISASVPPLAGGMGGAGVAGGVGQPEVSFRQRQQHLYILYMQRLRGQRRADGVVGGTAATGRGVNSGAAAGSTVMGHCEISAWGLSRLKEEWSLT